MTLENMPLNEAREYVNNYKIALSKTKQQLKEKQEEINIWEKRKLLAKSKDRIDLLNQTKNKLSDLKGIILDLEAEANDLQFEIIELNKELKMKEGFTPLTNSSALLDQFESLLGKDTIEETKINKEIENQILDDDLAKLKASIQGN